MITDQGIKISCATHCGQEQEGRWHCRCGWKSLGADSKGDEEGGSGFGMMAPETLAPLSFVSRDSVEISAE